MHIQLSHNIFHALSTYILFSLRSPASLQYCSSIEVFFSRCGPGLHPSNVANLCNFNTNLTALFIKTLACDIHVKMCLTAYYRKEAYYSSYLSDKQKNLKSKNQNILKEKKMKSISVLPVFAWFPKWRKHKWSFMFCVNLQTMMQTFTSSR